MKRVLKYSILPLILFTLILVLVYVQSGMVYESVSPAGVGKIIFHQTGGRRPYLVTVSVDDFGFPRKRPLSWETWDGTKLPDRAAWSRDGTMVAFHLMGSHYRWDYEYDFTVHLPIFPWRMTELDRQQQIPLLFKQRGGEGQFIFSDKVQFKDVARHVRLGERLPKTHR